MAACLVALLTAASGGAAQNLIRGVPDLSPEQHEGWLLTLQFCTMCHTFTTLRSSSTIGPLLSRESAGGQDEVLRQVIAEGLPNMPGFGLMFDVSQIAAIVAYLKTVPPDPPRQPGDKPIGTPPDRSRPQ